MFLEDEKPLLAPLPTSRFELSDWKTATVQFNYHISVDGMLYSVPYCKCYYKNVQKVENKNVHSKYMC